MKSKIEGRGRFDFVAQFASGGDAARRLVERAGGQRQAWPSRARCLAIRNSWCRRGDVEPRRGSERAVQAAMERLFLTDAHDRALGSTRRRPTAAWPCATGTSRKSAHAELKARTGVRDLHRYQQPMSRNLMQPCRFLWIIM